MRSRPITSQRIGPPIPPHPRRAHVPWHDPRCDQFAILDMAVADRSMRADINVCATRDGEIGAHWPESAKRNGYGYIARFGIRRRMTPDELIRPLAEWSTRDALRWRKTRTIAQQHGRHRPHTIPEWQRAARRRRVVPMYELKSQAFFAPSRAQRMAAQIRASGWPAYVMKLATQAHWREIVRAYHEATFRVGLLTEHITEPDDWSTWAPYVDRLLGTFAHPRKAA